jgi:hypothetical protein
MFEGTNDCVTPPAQHQIPMYEALAGGFRTLVTIEGASHCQFADPSTVCSLGESCRASISRAEQHATVWSLVGPWIRAVLLEEATALAEFQHVLDGTAGLVYAQDGIPTSVDVPSPLAGPPRVLPNPFNPRTVRARRARDRSALRGLPRSARGGRWNPERPCGADPMISSSIAVVSHVGAPQPQRFDLPSSSPPIHVFGSEDGPRASLHAIRDRSGVGNGTRSGLRGLPHPSSSS